MALYTFVCYGIWRVLEKLCSVLNIYIFVKTRAGLKNINIDSLYGEIDINKDLHDTITISPDKLFLSVDYLKDRFTLLDCCIIESPHYGLVKAINNGEDVKNTDYYKRFITGKLDGRHCQRKRKVSYFYDKNKKAKESIESGNYKPVQVYYWKGKYYICDGKHRAALCAYLQRDVKCVLVPSVSQFAHTAINKEIYRIMSGDKHFAKHIIYLSNE